MLNYTFISEYQRPVMPDSVAMLRNPNKSREKKMNQMVSLTKYEHQVLPKLRNQLNQSESVEDVKKFFISTIQELLGLATEGNLSAEYEDISLTPEQAPYYSLSPKIVANDAIKELGYSDLNAVLQRLAEQAAHRHQNLTKNNLKTNLKIKNH
jgi:hypothetical protein